MTTIGDVRLNGLDAKDDRIKLLDVWTDERDRTNSLNIARYKD